MDNRYETTGVGVLDKAMAILDLVESRPKNLNELMSEMRMASSTAHRLATALTRHGMLRRDGDGRYHLGPRFSQVALLDMAPPVLERLQKLTGESVQLWVRRGQHRLCVLSMESKEELRTTLEVGSFLPLPDGSAAQVLMGEQESGGWVESRATRKPGIGSVSAPVRVDGEVIAAVCLSGPLQRLDPSPGLLYGQAVVDAAHQIEQMLPSTQ